MKEALEKAKKENKLVFIDAYTAWCQPCVMMGKNVFTLDKVADFYNEHFINLKIDFGKEKELAEKYAANLMRFAVRAAEELQYVAIRLSCS